MVENIPEVRVLPSAGITRPRRSYDPVRHPLETGTLTAPSRPLPSSQMGLPRLPALPFPRAVPTTPADRNRCMCRCLPCPRGLPRFTAGSASASRLSRPAQALLTLRPAESLGRPRRPLSRGFDPASYPATPPVSFQNHRHLSGWNLPPSVRHALGAHSEAWRSTGDSRVLRSRGLLRFAVCPEGVSYRWRKVPSR